MKVEGRPGTPTMMSFSIPEVGVEVSGTGLMHDGVHGGEGRGSEAPGWAGPLWVAVLHSPETEDVLEFINAPSDFRTPQARMTSRGHIAWVCEVRERGAPASGSLGARPQVPQASCPRALRRVINEGGSRQRCAAQLHVSWEARKPESTIVALNEPCQKSALCSSTTA